MTIISDISDKNFLDLSDAAYLFALRDQIGGLTLARNLVGAEGKPIDLYNPTTGVAYSSSTAFRAVIYANADKSVIVEELGSRRIGVRVEFRGASDMLSWHGPWQRCAVARPAGFSCPISPYT